MTKTCIHCNKEYERKGDGNERWAKRKYCTRKCNDIARRRIVHLPSKDKPCLVCGVTFHKGYEEAWLKWKRRKFCSPKCAYIGRETRAPRTAFKKGNVPHNFKRVGYGYDAVHSWLRRHYKKKGVCEECEEKRKTQWSNISGDYKRDRKDFRELCYSCHTKIDHEDPKRPKYKGTVHN